MSVNKEFLQGAPIAQEVIIRIGKYYYMKFRSSLQYGLAQ